MAKPKQTIKHAKELKRVKQFITRAEKRGYRFTDTFKQSLKELSTQKLKALKPEKLYKLSTALSEAGEIITGTEYRKLERIKSALKGAETRRIKKQKIRIQEHKEPYYPDGGEIIYGNILEDFIERLQEPTPVYSVSSRGREFKKPDLLIQESNRQKNYLLNLTFNVAREIGQSELGWRLEAKADTVQSLTNYVLYGSNASKIQSAATELASIINNGALTLQQLKDIGEQEEYNEDWSEPE